MKVKNTMIIIMAAILMIISPGLTAFIIMSIDATSETKGDLIEMKVTAPGVYRAQISRWIDGDSAVADIALGYDVSLLNQRLRVARVNTPERGETDFEKAKSIAVKCGDDILIRGQDKDKYGRWLVEIYCEDTGDNLNNILIEHGWIYGE